MGLKLWCLVFKTLKHLDGPLCLKLELVPNKLKRLLYYLFEMKVLKNHLNYY
jgi:hypothetical protein